MKSKASTLLKNKAVYHHNILLSCLAYADDLVLVAQSREDLQAVLDSTSSHDSLLDMQFCPDKYATLGIINCKGEATRLDPASFTVQNHHVPTLAAHESYRSFQPALSYALCACDPKKKSLNNFHQQLIRTLHNICDLLKQSTQSYFFATKSSGGLALQDPNMEVDVQCVVQALKTLCSDDLTTSAIARVELHSVIHRTTSSNPMANLVTKFLLGCTVNPLHNLHYTYSSLWSTAVMHATNRSCPFTIPKPTHSTSQLLPQTRSRPKRSQTSSTATSNNITPPSLPTFLTRAKLLNL